MKIGELRKMIEDLPDNKEIAWELQGEMWAGSFYIGYSNDMIAEMKVVAEEDDEDYADYDQSQIPPPDTIVISMDL